MLKRLLLGLMIGVVLGGLGGVGLAAIGLSMSGVLGYVFAAVMGVLVGLIAGKPIWAKGALVEAGLKSTIGALLACGLLFGLRFAPITLPGVDVSGLAIKSASLGTHTIGALVSIATLLAVFYEIDNDGKASDDSTKGVRVATGVRVETATAEDDVEESSASAAKKRR
ncbi:MAG: hypothetical protein ACHREM_16640 [Polyangiales bacterium]